MYIRSVFSGQVFEVEAMPEFMGYEMVGKKEFVEYYNKLGMNYHDFELKKKNRE